MAAQDQVISTIYFKNKIFLEQTESEWPSCTEHAAATVHLISGCPILVKKDYIMRYHKVCAHAHYSLCKALGIETTDKNGTNTQTNTHKPVCEEDITVLWNHGLPTDREAAASRPDIPIEYKRGKKIHVDRCGNARGKKYHANGSRKETKTQDFMYRDATNVVHEMYCETSNYKRHIVKDPNITNTGNDERNHTPFDVEPVRVLHQLKAISPTVTVEWPTLSIENWLANVDCHTEHWCWIINLNHSPC
jgi:hypothetical protein